MGRASGIKIGPRVASLVAATLGVVCYLNTLGNGFAFDDMQVIVRNPNVSGGLEGLARLLTSHYWQHVTDAGNLYRPVTMASYWLNHALAGSDPLGYHMINILLHAVCSGLVTSLAVRLGMTPGQGLAAGSFFAAHPIHTEAVAGVVGRAELLAAGAVLAALVAHLSSRRCSTARAALVGALALAGLLSKENTIVLPALLGLVDIVRVRRGEATWREAAPAYLACALAVGAWLAVRMALLEPVPAGSLSESPFASSNATERILTALAVMGRYLWLLVVPARLSADYSYQQIPAVASPLDPLALGSAAALVTMGLAGAFGLLSSRIRSFEARFAAACALFFLAAIAPVSNLIVPIGTVMAERLLYLPSVAFCLVPPIAWSVMRPGRLAETGWRRLGVALTALLLALYAGRTLSRNADWRDDLTLFTATVRTSPRSAKAHYNLGVALEEAGRPAEALPEYLKAVEIRPDEARAQHNAGLLLAAMGQTREAADHLERAARMDPDLPGAFANLGAALFSLGRHAEAEHALREAVQRRPDDHDAWYNLGTVLISLGRPHDAIEPLERARDIRPVDPDGRFQLGLAYRQAGRPADALKELREALALMPTLGDAHVQIALACLDLGRLDEAAAAARRARQAGLNLPPELSSLLD